MNPTVNPIAILSVKGTPKSDIVRFVVWPLTLVSSGMYFVKFRSVNAAFCEIGCSLFQLMLTIC